MRKELVVCTSTCERGVCVPEERVLEDLLDVRAELRLGIDHTPDQIGLYVRVSNMNA